MLCKNAEQVSRRKERGDRSTADLRSPITFLFSAVESLFLNCLNVFLNYTIFRPISAIYRPSFFGNSGREISKPICRRNNMNVLDLLFNLTVLDDLVRGGFVEQCGKMSKRRCKFCV